MVTLPPQFVATIYQGYFFNLETRTLFSIKIGGYLRELKLLKKGSTPWGVYAEDCYQVSVNGQNRYLTMTYLNTLQPSDTVVPFLTRDQMIPFTPRHGHRARGSKHQQSLWNELPN